MEATLIKTQVGYIPATAHDVDNMAAIHYGEAIKVKFSKQRNVHFHRKFFALLGLAFDAWEPDTGKGEKNFDRFRKDIICKAGYYDLVVNIKGEVRAEAKSISFAKMDETEFTALYNNVVNVILKMILTNYTRDDLDNVVNQILEFGS